MLQEFADRFVREEMRERFVHEANKKPGKLYERICHQTSTVFEAKYLNGTSAFGQDEPCLVFAGGAARKMPWSKASLLLGSGGGVLIISESGQRFVAESESSPRTVTYSAGG